MRVGVIGPISPDSLADNILNCLPNLGVTPVPLGPAGPRSSSRVAQYAAEFLRRSGAEGEQLSQYALLRRARQSGCDVIINVQQSLTAKTVDGLKGDGSRIALWYPDAVSNIGRMSIVAGAYDALFLKDALFAQRLSRVYGLRAYYLPEACNPRWHRPVGDAGTDEHIAVVGNVYPTRARLLGKLHADGVPLSLYGGGFPRWLDTDHLRGIQQHAPVFRVDKAQVFRRARGVLNNLHPAEMDSVNCRLFEAAGSGGAVLCERRPRLGELFDEDREILSFDSYGELLSHCRNLLSSRDSGRTLGDAASRRATSDHTYEIRLSQIMEILG